MTISSSFTTNCLTVDDELPRRIFPVKNQPGIGRELSKLSCIPFHSIFPQFRRPVTVFEASTGTQNQQGTRNPARAIRTHIKSSNFSAISRKKEKCPAISIGEPASRHRQPRSERSQRASLIACRYVITQTRLNVPAREERTSSISRLHRP